MNHHIRHVQTLENTLVGIALNQVVLLQIIFGHVEGICILHHKFASTNHACTRTEFIAILGLNLIQSNRQILVGGIHILDHQGEHFLSSRHEQIVCIMTIFYTEEVISILFPTVRSSVWIFWQKHRKFNFLSASFR